MIEKIITVTLYSFCITVFAVWAIIYIPFLLVFGPNKSTWLRRLYAQFMIKAGFNKLVIINAPPPNRGPYLFVMNHQSLFDGFMLAAVLPYHFSILAKKEIFSLPLFGFIIRRLGFIPLDRKNYNDSLSSLSQAAEKIKSGIPVAIFPEGTRTKNGQIGLFKKGAFRLAFEAKAIIVPAGITGSYHCQPSGQRLLRPGVLKINFGQPMSYDSYSSLAIFELSDLVKKQIIELSNDHL
ncbi:MAG: lysophospholipid acyltransferase family protein [Candidatus Buchananbacteria bacterium]|nr:lysophospholipid acyltransferase family protein [Candidatus Buchananbacteria bacterium]